MTVCVQDLLNKTLSVAALRVKPGRNICASFTAKGEDEKRRHLVVMQLLQEGY